MIEQAIRPNGGRICGSHQQRWRWFSACWEAPTRARCAPSLQPTAKASSHRNGRGVRFIGTPAVWPSLGLHGEGVKIASIDTGIDYTHANFAGPGTPAAYTVAHAGETMPADPRFFGPSAPRVKGGIDLVGDS